MKTVNGDLFTRTYKYRVTEKTAAMTSSFNNGQQFRLYYIEWKWKGCGRGCDVTSCYFHDFSAVTEENYEKHQCVTLWAKI